MNYVAASTQMIVIGALAVGTPSPNALDMAYEDALLPATISPSPLWYGDCLFEDDRQEFDSFRQQWQAETKHSSIIAARYSHPAYQGIIAMGKPAIPWILGELRDRPDRWFAALKILTKQDPAAESKSFASAAQAWLKWGQDNGYNV